MWHAATARRATIRSCSRPPSCRGVAAYHYRPRLPPRTSEYRLPCTVYRVPCTVYRRHNRLPSTVYRLPSTVYPSHHRPPYSLHLTTSNNRRTGIMKETNGILFPLPLCSH